MHYSTAVSRDSEDTFGRTELLLRSFNAVAPVLELLREQHLARAMGRIGCAPWLQSDSLLLAQKVCIMCSFIV